MWPNPQFPADLVTFNEKSLMENFIFCAVVLIKISLKQMKTMYVYIQNSFYVETYKLLKIYTLKASFLYYNTKIKKNMKFLVLVDREIKVPRNLFIIFYFFEKTTKLKCCKNLEWRK